MIIGKNSKLRESIKSLLVPVKEKRLSFSITIIALVVAIVTALAAIFSYNNHKTEKALLLESKIDSLISEKSILSDKNAIHSFEKIEVAKALLAKDSNPRLLGKVLISEASLEKKYYQYEKAIACYKKAIALFSKDNSRLNLAEAYYKLGDCYKKVGIFDLGFKATVKGLNLYIEEKDLMGQRRCYNNIGSFYKYLGEYDKALAYYQKTLAISQELGYSEGISSAFNNLGTIYSEMGKNELALDFYHKSNIGKSKLSTKSIAIYNGNVGGVLLKMGKYKESYAALRKAQYYLSKNFDPRNQVSNYNDFGDYYKATGRIDSSIYFYHKALSLAKQYKLHERILKSYDKLAEAYQKAGMYQKALEYQNQYLNLQEIILNSQKSLEIARLEMNFEASKDQMSRNSAKQKSFFLLVIFILICISFVLTIHYIRNKHKSIVRKHIQLQHTLKEEKCKVETDLNEKNRELALHSLQMIQQQETNKAIIQKLYARSTSYSTDVRRELSSIIHDLERENTSKAIWDEFEHRFIAVNPEFYQKLLLSFPDLTQNEKRLCAFLKLNMNTKEISTITGQTPHSINVARTRLRKKLGLSNSEVCTCDFLATM